MIETVTWPARRRRSVRSAAPLSPNGHRNARGSKAVITCFALLSCAAAGCATSDAPGYNPYARPDSEPTILERADAFMDGLGNAVDGLDQRMENAVY